MSMTKESRTYYRTYNESSWDPGISKCLRLMRKKTRRLALGYFFSKWKVFVGEVFKLRESMHTWKDLMQRKKCVTKIISRKNYNCIFKSWFSWYYNLIPVRRAKRNWAHFKSLFLFEIWAHNLQSITVRTVCNQILIQKYFNVWRMAADSTIIVPYFFRWRKCILRRQFRKLYFFMWRKSTLTSRRFRKQYFRAWSLQMKIISRCNFWGNRKLRLHFSKWRLSFLWRKYVRTLKALLLMKKIRDVRQKSAVVCKSVNKRKRLYWWAWKTCVRKSHGERLLNKMQSTWRKQKVFDSLLFSVVAHRYGNAVYMVSFEIRRQRNVIRTITNFMTVELGSKAWVATFDQSIRFVVRLYEGVVSGRGVSGGHVFNPKELLKAIDNVKALPKKWKQIIKSHSRGGSMSTCNNIITSITVCTQGMERLRHLLIREIMLFECLQHYFPARDSWRIGFHQCVGSGTFPICNMPDIPACLTYKNVNFFTCLERWKIFLNCVYTEMINPRPLEKGNGTMEVILTETCQLTGEIAAGLSTATWAPSRTEMACEYCVSVLADHVFFKLGEDTRITAVAMNRLNERMAHNMEIFNVNKFSRIGGEYISARHRMCMESMCQEYKFLKWMQPLTEGTMGSISDVGEMHCMLCRRKYDMRELSQCPILAVDNTPVCIECITSSSKLESLCQNTVMRTNPPENFTDLDITKLTDAIAKCLTKQ